MPELVVADAGSLAAGFATYLLTLTLRLLPVIGMPVR